jgi:hypothetical protein
MCGTEMLKTAVETQLIPHVRIESVDPFHPVVVRHVPSPWVPLGRGNYAAVFTHPDYPEAVVKVYAPGRRGFEKELEVYRRLGDHPAYSRLEGAGDNYLILRRLHGITLYDAVHRGVAIPERVIEDIDQALDYARSRGLQPHDVHGRNVMLSKEGRGQVVDVSDFLEEDEDAKWRHLKIGYYLIYRPLLLPLRVRVPYAFLDFTRACYRTIRRLLRR